MVQIIIDFNFNLGSPSCVESEVNDESRSGIHTEGPGGLQMQSLSATQNSTSYWSMYIYVTNDYVKTPVITNEDGFRRNMNMSPTALVDDNEFLGAIPAIIDVRNLFPSLHQHALDTTPVNAEIHSVSLVKLLVFRFFKVRCLSYLKLLNSKNTEETSIRNSILKQIQFKGL